MRIQSLLLLLLFFALAFSTYAQRKQNIYLIAIGVTEYAEGHNLSYSLNDARSIDSILKMQPNFEVHSDTLFNARATNANIKVAFGKVKREMTPNDFFVFYFSGHGHSFELELYRFDPSNYQLESVLKKDTLTKLIGSLPGGKIILLDACQSYSMINPGQNPITTEARKGSPQPLVTPQMYQNQLDSLKRVAKHPEKMFLAGASSFSNISSYEDKYLFRQHGVFTQAFLDCLHGYPTLMSVHTGATFVPDLNNDGFISFNELKIYINHAVTIYSLLEQERNPAILLQTPVWVSASIYEDFPFFAVLNDGKERPHPFAEKLQSGNNGQLPDNIGGKKGVAGIDLPDDFVKVVPGSFVRKDSLGQDQTVVLNHLFYMEQREVTQGLWRRYMHDRPSSYLNCDECPVTDVSWHQVQAFIDSLERYYPGYIFRLPTEAEWELAARDSMSYRFAGDHSVLNVGWIRDNSNIHPHETRKLKPNKRGLYDMTGNVMEWCDDYYVPRSTSPLVKNPVVYTKPEYDDARTIKGGSYNCTPKQAELSRRMKGGENERFPFVGFRLIIEY